MTNVTNKHDGMLNVAGVDIRPGATVDIDSDELSMWSQAPAAKAWLKAGVVYAEGVEADDETVVGNDVPERLKLEADARRLEVVFSSETTDDELRDAIEDSRNNHQVDEREALMAQARELGLNPNGNTGLEKLRKMVADKQAEQA